MSDYFIIHDNMKSRTKAFTLIELIISIVIVWLLAWVIFSTYRTILDITVRVENEKIVANEMLFAHQIIQSLVDNYTIDFSRYGYVIPNNGLTDSLYLTWRWANSTYIWWYTITLWGVYNDQIMLTKEWWSSIPLTDHDSVTMSGLQFQITPSNAHGTWLIPVGSLYFNSINDIYHPAFWMRGVMYVRNYKENTYIRSVKQPLQSFFNIRSY